MWDRLKRWAGCIAGLIAALASILAVVFLGRNRDPGNDARAEQLAVETERTKDEWNAARQERDARAEDVERALSELEQTHQKLSEEVADYDARKQEIERKYAEAPVAADAGDVDPDMADRELRRLSE